MKLNPHARARNAEQRGRGRFNTFNQQLRNGNQNQNQLPPQHEIETPKINRFTPIRKELCHQFAQQTNETPGSEIWINQLVNFLMSKGQLGVTRDSIKVWYGRQPTFFQAGIPRTGNGAGPSNGARTRSSPMNFHENVNNNFNIPAQTQQQQQQQFPPSFSYSYQIPMQMPIQTPPPNPAPISAELLDYQQKREDFNNSFEYIRQLHNIFARQENLATCLIPLEKIQAICSRANNKLVLPSTYRDNTKERLGQLAKLVKQEMGHASSVVNQEEDVLGDIPDPDSDQDPEMVILS